MDGELASVLREPLSFPTRRSSDLKKQARFHRVVAAEVKGVGDQRYGLATAPRHIEALRHPGSAVEETTRDRKSTRLNSSHVESSYAVFCLKTKRLPHDNPALLPLE